MPEAESPFRTQQPTASLEMCQNVCQNTWHGDISLGFPPSKGGKVLLVIQDGFVATNKQGILVTAGF